MTRSPLRMTSLIRFGPAPSASLALMSAAIVSPMVKPSSKLTPWLRLLKQWRPLTDERLGSWNCSDHGKEVPVSNDKQLILPLKARVHKPAYRPSLGWHGYHTCTLIGCGGRARCAACNSEMAAMMQERTR